MIQDEAADSTYLTTRVLAPNPGPMTLEGTNTYVVRRPGSDRVAVIDPGPLDGGHLRGLAAHGQVELILLTHEHQDHAEGARELSAMTDSPIRAVDPSRCVNARPLGDGEELVAGGTRLRVIATPGHTADSVCFYLEDDADVRMPSNRGSMLTGDTILGRGTAAIGRPGGSLRAYIASLELLCSFGSALVLPGHGPRLDDLNAVAAGYLTHRRSRLEDISSAVDRLRSSTADDVTVAGVTDLVYPNVAPELRFAAEGIVQAQLDYLVESVEPPNLPSVRGGPS
jgi:glyoxylase-like metal-dependent hydrolase (beta-lactamase superfamily II)